MQDKTSTADYQEKMSFLTHMGKKIHREAPLTREQDQRLVQIYIELTESDEHRDILYTDSVDIIERYPHLQWVALKYAEDYLYSPRVNPFVGLIISIGNSTIATVTVYILMILMGFTLGSQHASVNCSSFLHIPLETHEQ